MSRTNQSGNDRNEFQLDANGVAVARRYDPAAQLADYEQQLSKILSEQGAIQFKGTPPADHREMKMNPFIGWLIPQTAAELTAELTKLRTAKVARHRRAELAQRIEEFGAALQAAKIDDRKLSRAVQAMEELHHLRRAVEQNLAGPAALFGIHLGRRAEALSLIPMEDDAIKMHRHRAVRKENVTALNRNRQSATASKRQGVRAEFNRRMHANPDQKKTALHSSLAGETGLTPRTIQRYLSGSK